MAKKQEASKDEQIGFHKGALSTLAKERQEFAKLLSIVEQLMHVHVKALKELGVDLEAVAKEAQNGQKEKEPEAKKKDVRPLDDIV